MAFKEGDIVKPEGCLAISVMEHGERPGWKRRPDPFTKVTISCYDCPLGSRVFIRRGNSPNLRETITREAEVWLRTMCQPPKERKHQEIIHFKGGSRREGGFLAFDSAAISLKGEK